MSKGDHVEIEGIITDAMGGGQYTIRMTGQRNNFGSPGTTVRAQLSGKMKKNHIRVLPGDAVRVSVSPYDLTHGMITFRSK